MVDLDSAGSYLPLRAWRYRPVGSSDEENGHAKRESDSDQDRICYNFTNFAWHKIFGSKDFVRLILVVIIFGLAAYIISLKRPKTQYIVPSMPQQPASVPIVKDYSEVDWSMYAYSQYVTNTDYLCNSVMIFEALHRVGSLASRFMMYPHDWEIDANSQAVESKLLVKARDEYNVSLVPIEVQHLSGDATWADSFTKLLAFNQTQYKRVISLDSDATVLQPMDELFFLPSAPVGMPRAYWLDQPFLSSQLVIIEPSKYDFSRIQKAFETKSNDQFDMEIVNDIYGKDCIIIPHRRYDLLTGEFRAEEHYKYLGSEDEQWDPEKHLAEAKFLHFSDWPFPKPWITSSEGERKDLQPKCFTNDAGVEDCRNRDLWNNFYTDFRDRRNRICDV